jgi:propanol-preferring alcohol dehydrogenase
MKAWRIDRIADLTKEDKPLTLVELPIPEPQPGQLLIKVRACGVCHTEIDEIEGRTPPPRYPVIPGHQVVGIVEKHAGIRRDIRVGDRVGVAWIFGSCGHCEYCLSGRENLCLQFTATGRDADGGYAEYMLAREDYIYPIPDKFTDAEAAPLLCAGAVGYRSLTLCRFQEGGNLGLTGFGASAHLVLKTVQYLHPDVKVFAFARSAAERRFAISLGCAWAGDTNERPPEKLDSLIDTTPVWYPVVEGLDTLKPGGRLVINAIRKEETDKDSLFRLHYVRHLWMEKEIKSVANVTRQDVQEFLQIAASMEDKPEVEEYPFEKANEALSDIKDRHIRGAKVLIMPNRER